MDVADTPTALGEQPPATSADPLLHTALIDAHRRLGARLVEFGGWEMPLSYGEGTLSEHRACRRDAVLFDVSHLGTVRVEGADAFDRLQGALANDLRRIGPGRAQYTHLLDDADGSVVDDIIVWWLSDDVFDVMPNASNTRRVEEAIGGEDTTRARCVIAVQGPHARTRLATVAPDAAAVPRFGVAPFVWEGVPCVAAGTGYTGEDGVECAVPVDAADALWTALLGSGIKPAGLGRVTPCAWRPPCPCTATSSARASPRCRPVWAGSSAGTSPPSAVVPPWPPNGNGGWPAGWSGCPPRGASPRAGDRRSARMAGRPGR